MNKDLTMERTVDTEKNFLKNLRGLRDLCGKRFS
jgi:hypothetical protein